MNIKELSEVMIEHGLVIRAIPKTVTAIYDPRHKNKYPSGVIKYDERLNRDMLFVESIPGNAGKFIIRSEESSNATVQFYKSKVYDTPIQAVEDFLENLNPKQRKNDMKDTKTIINNARKELWDRENWLVERYNELYNESTIAEMEDTERRNLQSTIRAELSICCEAISRLWRLV